MMGATALRVPIAPVLSHLNGIYVVSANADLSRILIAGQDSNRVAVSLDKGTSFTRFGAITLEFPDSIFRDSLVVNDNIALLASIGGDYIYRTTNFGTSWASITAPGLRNWGSFAMSDDTNKIIASSATGSFLSTDQGATWTARTNNAPGAQAYNSLVCSADFSVLYSWDFATGKVISKSVDDGQTWTALSNQPIVGNFWQGMHCSADGQTIMLGGVQGDFARSVDGGANWTYQTLTNTTLNVFNRRSPGTTGQLAALGGNFCLFISHNSGASWATDPRMDPYWVNDYTSPWHVCLSTDGVSLVTGTEYFNQQVLVRRRSEEHTSELQSLRHLVCRLLLEK